ncbi:LytR/AlgR family response regulator transcription factor [Aquabacterium sp. OR-4]|uniref:LytR/AlgR family response regulator transcription factor n=1 Tax=Aquabacterium sp. OR-4 TaxID=2978127 RepID=UPI0021B49C54|nr:LytTR family DNA-binding domain-containing protein [Aquabacterium sp. OR-4]MDT7834815.1 LytTR family DNA-binding domain-containing protein [Aquabacterium sp. OR-4]
MTDRLPEHPARLPHGRPAPTALVADDEPALARALVAQLATAWPALRIVAVARHGDEAAERIAALQPDLAFLDIQMPGQSGLDVAEGIEGPTRVVFVTAYDQHAVQAFDQQALDYLLKPVSHERLARTVARLQQHLAADHAAATGQAPAPAADARLLAALRQLAQAPAPPASPPLRWIRASAGDLTHQLAVEQVLFFRADDKYTCVQTAGAEHLIRTPIVELAAQLDAQQFVQVHRSTLVNLAHLAGTRRDEASRLWLRLHGWPHELPVSRAYVHLFKPM